MDMAGIPQDICLHLALQILKLLPTIPIDFSFHAPISIMLAYGPESYASRPWLKEGGETSSLGKKARASCLLTKKLKQLAHEEKGEDSSPEISASLAGSCGSTAHGSQHLPPAPAPQGESPGCIAEVGPN